ncbi:hypothetical protein KFU94_34440 [Chloroflexi bacterium TSY]|nr:hypothetical protein [Chloroflexi bacterium TSY]MBV7333247.1 hypothetical protein [Chloroflexi bacterium TSY]
MNNDLLAPDMMFEIRILLGWVVGVVITLLWVSAQRRWQRKHEEFRLSKELKENEKLI